MSDDFVREEQRFGWAVITGCEGDGDVQVVAYFAHRNQAVDYFEKCRKNPDDECFLLDGDTQVVPACVYSSGCFLLCNLWEERRVMAKMANEIGWFDSGEIESWLAESPNK